MRLPATILLLSLAACGQGHPGPAAAEPAQASATPAAPSPSTQTGAIAGELSYPSERIPGMRVCAFELAEATPYCVSTVPGQGEYRIDAIPYGDYLVLAYPQDGDGAPGGYTGCVDELSASCTDHDLRVVVVKPGETTTKVDPADYYAGDAAVDWPLLPTPQ